MYEKEIKMLKVKMIAPQGSDLFTLPATTGKVAAFSVFVFLRVQCRGTKRVEMII